MLPSLAITTYYYCLLIIILGLSRERHRQLYGKLSRNQKCTVQLRIKRNNNSRVMQYNVGTFCLNIFMCLLSFFNRLKLFNAIKIHRNIV